MNNIFNLPDPQNCFCHIHHYARGHSILEVWICDDLYKWSAELIFHNVRYYSGSMGWRSADFTLGSPDEVLEIFKQVTISKLPDDFILEFFSLYKVDLATAPIRILAGKMISPPRITHDE